MTNSRSARCLPRDSIAAPLRHAVFRRIWLASLLSNLGLLIQGVGAAWAMTQMTSSADKVALVQTALMLPIMLISMPAGAIADMHDRRVVALVVAGDLAGRRHRADRAGLAQSGHAEYPAGVLLHRRQRHGAVRAGLAILGQRAGAAGNPAARRSRSTASATTSRAALARRSAASSSRPPGAVAAFAANALLYLPLLVVLFLWKPQQRAVAPAARAAQPRHGLRRALHHQLALDHDRADAHAGHRHHRRLGVGADAADRARSAAWRRADLRHHARRLRHGRGDRRAQYRRSAQAPDRRGRDPRLHAVDGGRDRRGRAQHGAGADGGGAGGRRRGMDAGGGAVQYRRAALGAALGRRPFAGGVPGRDCRRHRGGKLGLGPSHRSCRRRDRAVGFRRPDAALAAARHLAADAAGRRAQRGGRRTARRSRSAAVADGAQRAAGGRDRIPRRRRTTPAPSTT